VSCAENLPDAQLTTQSSHWMLFGLQGVLYSAKNPAKQYLHPVSCIAAVFPIEQQVSDPFK
jgi:hypothetical protein